MLNMHKPAPRRESDSSVMLGCGLLLLVGVILLAVLAGCASSFRSGPAGGGSGDTSGCEWELKRNKLRSHSLTYGSKLDRVTTVAYSPPKPRPRVVPKPYSPQKPVYRLPTVKVTKTPAKMPVVKVTRTPVRMPTVRPHKPSTVRKGYHWAYDCD